MGEVGHWFSGRLRFSVDIVVYGLRWKSISKRSRQMPEGRSQIHAEMGELVSLGASRWMISNLWAFDIYLCQHLSNDDVGGQLHCAVRALRNRYVVCSYSKQRLEIHAMSGITTLEKNIVQII